MGILDWFKNRSAQFDPERQSDEIVLKAVDKAVTLTNPRLKLLRDYQARLAPSVEHTVKYLRSTLSGIPPAISVSEANWMFEPAVRAFFVAASDIPPILGRSRNLRTLFDKYPGLEEAHFVLGMSYSEQRSLGVCLQGEMVQHDVAQTSVGFSDHQVRICGHTDQEVLRLLGTQGFEYIVAQAMRRIGEERTERRELEENRALIRARLRLLQQQGPGLGSVFNQAPEAGAEQVRLEAQLLENDQQMEVLSSQSVLEQELEYLIDVLEHPEQYLGLESRVLRLSTMNVLLDDASTDVSAEVGFSLATLRGQTVGQRAFVLARFSREEMPVAGINFAAAERYL